MYGGGLNREGGLLKILAQRGGAYQREGLKREGGSFNVMHFLKHIIQTACFIRSGLKDVLQFYAHSCMSLESRFISKAVCSVSRTNVKSDVLPANSFTLRLCYLPHYSYKAERGKGLRDILEGRRLIYYHSQTMCHRGVAAVFICQKTLDKGQQVATDSTPSWLVCKPLWRTQSIAFKI